jgi:adenosine deaminase
LRLFSEIPFCSKENLDKLVIPCIDSKMFKSIDLYGNELNENFDFIKEYYEYARQK